MSRENNIVLQKFYRTILQKDPLLYGHQFVITFSGDLPSFIPKVDDYTSITYYCKSTTIPKVTLQETTVNFLSQDFVVPRQVQYDEKWSVNVIIDQNMTYYQSLYDWQNIYASLKLSGGGNKVIPSIQAHVTLLDSTMQNNLTRFTLEGVFPSNIPDLAMEYKNQADVLEFPCEFTYQYIYDEDDGNPLDAAHRS